MAIQSYLVFAQFGLFLGRYGSKMPRSLVIQQFFVISGNSLKPPGHKRNRPKILPEVALHFLEHSVLSPEMRPWPLGKKTLEVIKE